MWDFFKIHVKSIRYYFASSSSSLILLAHCIFKSLSLQTVWTEEQPVSLLFTQLFACVETHNFAQCNLIYIMTYSHNKLHPLMNASHDCNAVEGGINTQPIVTSFKVSCFNRTIDHHDETANCCHAFEHQFGE